MKRNRHQGLNVEFDRLCIDFGHVSLNKKKEFLCGDCYKLKKMIKIMCWFFRMVWAAGEGKYSFHADGYDAQYHDHQSGRTG